MKKKCCCGQISAHRTGMGIAGAFRTLDYNPVMAYDLFLIVSLANRIMKTDFT